MKKKLWIFGDSFFSNAHNPKNNIGWSSFAHLLDSEYEVTHFAMSGSGNDFQIHRLIEQVNKLDDLSHLSDVSVIYGLGEMQMRLCLSDMPDNLQAYLKVFTDTPSRVNDEIERNVAPDRREYMRKLYNRYHDFATLYVTDFLSREENNNQVLKTLCTLDQYAKHFKQFLTMPIFTFDGSKLKHTQFENMDVTGFTLMEMATASAVAPVEFQRIAFPNRKKLEDQPYMSWPNHLDQSANQLLYAGLSEWMETQVPPVNTQSKTQHYTEISEISGRPH